MEEKVKRLQFLEALLAGNDVSKYELARRMGVTFQNIFTYFKRDDMKLSYAQEIADRLGYTLSFSLDGEASKAGGAFVQVESLLGENGLCRLAFLKIAMKLYGIERKALAEELDMNYNGINRWFRVDDIAISYIFRIAELHDLKVHVKAMKKQDNPAMMEIL